MRQFRHNIGLLALALAGLAFPRPGFTASATNALSGAGIYHGIGCVACHDPIDHYRPTGSDEGVAWPAIKNHGAAISTSRFKDVDALAEYLQHPGSPTMPEMGLSDAEALALAEYLHPRFKDIPPIKREQINLDSPDLDFRLANLGCLNCHTRDGKGGPEPGRAMYFKPPIDYGLGDEGIRPPSLTGVGRKLKPAAMRKIIRGEGAARPYLPTRMPNFGAAQAEWLSEALISADRGMQVDEADIFFYGRNMYGRKLMGTEGGKGCITCHKLKGRPSLGIPAIDLALSYERLQPQWFQNYLLDPQALKPGTRMPPLFDAKKVAKGRKAATPYPDIAHIWTYLKEIDQSPLPPGMVTEKTFELIPKDTPIVFRTFMEHAGMEAIAVGFPEGIHAAFDARRCRWVMVWKGRFLDAESTWIDRFTPPAKPLGSEVQLLDLVTPRNAEFAGYQLDLQGVPTLLYAVDGRVIKDTLRPIGNDRFERTITSPHATTREVLSW